MNESSEEENLTPPDVLLAPSEQTHKLLPDKSRKAYEKQYQDLMSWKATKNAHSFSENVLLEYFEDKISSNNKVSTLWTIYSMLKSTLSIYHQVDISKYYKLIGHLKRRNEGFKGKKSKIFSCEDINKFINEAPDILYLSTKVVLIFGVMGACRRQELYNVQASDVNDFGSTILVKITNTKTNTIRSFTITGTYYDICKKYMNLRPFPCHNPAFFLHYFGGKCTALNVGINKFGNLGKTIATYLELPNPELYTGHCFRRTSATLLVDADGDITTRKRHWGMKSTAIGEGCMERTLPSENQLSNNNLNSIENTTHEISIDVPLNNDSKNCITQSELVVTPSYDEEMNDNNDGQQSEGSDSTAILIVQKKVKKERSHKTHKMKKIKKAHSPIDNSPEPYESIMDNWDPVEPSPPLSKPKEEKPNIDEIEDEFELFGKYISAQLKNMPFRQALEAQQHIQSFLTQFRLQHMEGGTDERSFQSFIPVISTANGDV